MSIPYITINANDDPWAAGVPVMPSVQPMQVLQVSNKMNFWERLQNTIAFAAIQVAPMIFMQSSLIEEFAPNKPPVSFADLYLQSQLFLVNLDAICFDYPRISAPNYIFLPGAGNVPAKPLPADLDNFVSKATDGVVLVSFGSIPAFSKMPPPLMKVFMDAFAGIPQKVVMKYDGEPYPNVPANVRLLSWLPQNDILGHPNVKLFITHGGNNGQLEALFHAVPMLTIPITGDQYYNAERVVAHGYGLKTSFQSLTSKELRSRTKDIVSNHSFNSNIQKCSEIIRSFPTPQSTIVFWVNHVLEFGGDHLRLPSSDLNYFQMFMFDVMLFVLVVSGLALYLSVRLFSFILRCVFRALCPSLSKKKND